MPAKCRRRRTALEAAVGARVPPAGRRLRAVQSRRHAGRPLKKTDGRALHRVRHLSRLIPTTKQQSWSQAPQVRQFPDRFVVLGFTGAAQTLEAVGDPVTLPLYTGPDPRRIPTTTIRPDPLPMAPTCSFPTS